MAEDTLIDVLVIGSGAAGLAAGVAATSAGARVAVATKTTLQACNSAKAQGGIQASFGADDSPDLHAEDVMRSSHETAEPALVDVLTSEARGAIGWLEQLGCSSHARTAATASPAAAARRASGSCRSATGRGTPSRRRCERRTRRGRGTSSPISRLTELAPGDNGWRATFATPDGTDGRRRDGRAGVGRPVLRRGRDPRRALDEPPQRDRRDDADRDGRGRGDTRPGRPPVPPERRRLAGDHAGLLDPRDDARLRRRPAQRRPRGVHRLARPARRGLEGDLRRGRGRARRPHRGRAPGGLARHDADRARRRGGVAPVHAPPLPGRRDRPARRADPHVPRPPLPERRPRDRHGRRDDARGRLRLRRDRRRDARAKPHDGQLTPRVRRLRPPRRARPPRRKRRHDDDHDDRSRTRPSRTQPRTSTSGR